MAQLRDRGVAVLAVLVGLAMISSLGSCSRSSSGKRKGPGGGGKPKSPTIVDALYQDSNPNCRVDSGDTVEILFDSPVDVIPADPHDAFFVLPGDPPDAFGVGATFDSPTSGVSSVVIRLGAQPTLAVDGTFAPSDPDLGPSGIDVELTPQTIVASGKKKEAEQLMPPGVDVRGQGNRVTSAFYIDDGDQAFGEFDRIRVYFCRRVRFDPAATPGNAFQLPVDQDSFGTGSNLMLLDFRGAPPDTRPYLWIDIQLGANPRIQSNGLFDPMTFDSGKPSGVDVSGSAMVTDSASGIEVSPRGPLPGVDIQGPQNIGRWQGGGTLAEGRFYHTATLLPQGSILVVGGAIAQPGGNPDWWQSLDSIEIYEPATNSSSIIGNLVEPRFGHRAVLTAGPDKVADTNDDYVVIVGGVNSDRDPADGDAGSINSVEVIHPDPNGDGDFSDLVVNPGPGGIPLGAPALPQTWTNGTPGCASGGLPFGYWFFDAQWMPFDDATNGGHVAGPNTGNNEIALMGGGGLTTFDCGSGRQYWQLWGICSSSPTCEDQMLVFVLDENSDGDVSDSSRRPICAQGLPLAPDYSLDRADYTHTRIAGPDGTPGNADDAHLVYGGTVFDRTADCLGNPSCPGWRVGELDYFSWDAWRTTGQVVHTGLNACWQACIGNSCGATCGTYCLSPGVGSTDRSVHAAVASTNSDQEVVVFGGGTSASVWGTPCERAVEVITPDNQAPWQNASIRTVGLDPISRNGQTAGAVLDGSGNVLAAGGIDKDQSMSTASSIYVRLDGMHSRVDPVRDMSFARSGHILVSVPAAALGFPEDRVYAIGGMVRDTTFGVCSGPPYCNASVVANVEYFTEQ